MGHLFCLLLLAGEQPFAASSDAYREAFLVYIVGIAA
jgi:hypothetical protein